MRLHALRRRSLGRGALRVRRMTAELRVLPIFAVRLQTSIVPERFCGPSGTPSFTRASPATGFDFEGRAFTALSGEARTFGARRVYNLIPAAGTGSASLAVAANKTMTVGVGTFVFSMGAEATGTSLITFTGTATGSTGTLTANATKRTAATLTITGAGTIIATCTVVGAVDLQLEDVTGQTNQNPSSYVSVGVIATPWHGAGVDAVRYLDTLNANTVASNIVTEATGAHIDSSQAAAAGGVTAGVVDASGPIGFYAEGARTNLALQSNAFTTTWTNLGSPAATQNAVAPDGTTTAWTLTDNDAAVFEGIQQTGVVFTTGATCVFSISIQKTGTPVYPFIQIIHDVANTLYTGLIINEAAGTIVGIATGGSYVAPVAKTIVSQNADYWRVSFSFVQSGATQTATIQMYPAGSLNGTSIDAAGVGSTVFAWAQFETASFASTYIPTTTVAVTRNGSVDQYVSSGNVPTNNFTLYGETTWTTVPTAVNEFLWASWVDADNYTAVLRNGANLIARKRIAGVNADATKALTPVAGTAVKWAARFSSTTGIDIFHTGAIGTNDATTTACQIGTNFQVGADGNGANQPFAANRNVRIYGVTRQNQVLQDMTTDGLQR